MVNVSDTLPEVDPVAELVARLLASYASGPRTMHHLGAYELPQMAEVVKCVDEIRALLFPGFVGAPLVGAAEARNPGDGVARATPPTASK